MAQKVNIFMIDDIDGLHHEGIETVKFGLHHAVYEIDLKPEHRKELEESLARFIDAARVVKKDKTVRRPSKDTARIRAWAKEQGLDVAERGRIHQDIVEKYKQAQSQSA